MVRLVAAVACGLVCSGCAGATCVINQGTLRNLRNQVAEWSREHDSPGDGQGAGG